MQSLIKSSLTAYIIVGCAQIWATECDSAAQGNKSKFQRPPITAVYISSKGHNNVPASIVSRRKAELQRVLNGSHRLLDPSWKSPSTLNFKIGTKWRMVGDTMEIPAEDFNSPGTLRTPIIVHEYGHRLFQLLAYSYFERIFRLPKGILASQEMHGFATIFGWHTEYPRQRDHIDSLVNAASEGKIRSFTDVVLGREGDGFSIYHELFADIFAVLDAKNLDAISLTSDNPRLSFAPGIDRWAVTSSDRELADILNTPPSPPDDPEMAEILAELDAACGEREPTTPEQAITYFPHNYFTDVREAIGLRILRRGFRTSLFKVAEKILEDFKDELLTPTTLTPRERNKRLIEKLESLWTCK